MKKQSPGRKKELHGSKLHDNAKLELEVVKWLGKEPTLSNLAISSRLLKEFKFRFSAPSVKQWRLNYYIHIEKQLIDNIKDRAKEEEDVEDNISLKRLDYIKELKSMSNEVDARIRSLKTAIDKELNLKAADGTTSLFEMNRTYLMLESQHESLIKTKAQLLKQIGELIGPDDWADKVGEIMKKTIQVCIDTLKPLLPEESREAAIKEMALGIRNLQNELKEEFLING